MSAEGMQHPLELVLTREVQCSERLLQCLEAERSALTERDMDGLETSINNKIQYTQSLEQLERERENLVSELGFAADAEGLRLCFNSLPQADNLKRLWQRVLSNIEACRSSNLTNGGILESGRQHVEQALSILRGQSGSPSLYDTRGGHSANLGQRELGKV